MQNVRTNPTNLARLRQQAGLTQKELAQLLGCKTAAKVSRYERGLRVPGLKTLMLYEDLFNVKLKDLFPQTNNPS